MTIYKISIHNKTNNSIFYKITDCSESYKSELKELKQGSVMTDNVNSTVINLYLWKTPNTDNEPNFKGSVPSEVFLEIFEDETNLSVYMENEKIPSHIITDICKVNKNTLSTSTIVVIIVCSLLVFLMCIIFCIFLLKKKNIL